MSIREFAMIVGAVPVLNVDQGATFGLQTNGIRTRLREVSFPPPSKDQGVITSCTKGPSGAWTNDGAC